MTTKVKMRHPILDVSAGKFNTVSGKIIDINNPIIDMFCIEDIITGLSNLCRFGGQSNQFYSIAQHSILVSILAPESLKKAALMHDASEAYLGDIISPLKKILGSLYYPIEESFMKLIWEKYNLNWDDLAAIKGYDLKALEMEHVAFQQGDIVDWSFFWSKHDYYETSFSPEQSQAIFRNRFAKLFDHKYFNC